MKNNIVTSNEVKPEVKTGISNPTLPVFNSEKPSSLKANWIVEPTENHRYYGKTEEIKSVFKSKGKSIVIMNDESIIGVRNFPPMDITSQQEHIEYLKLTLEIQKSIIPENTESKKRINIICGLLSGSEGIFGKSFLACKSITGKHGRYVDKVNQKEISNKLENLLNQVKK